VEIEETFLKSIIKKIMAKTIVLTIVMVKPNYYIFSVCKDMLLQNLGLMANSGSPA